jgi:hypothetical protein
MAIVSYTLETLPQISQEDWDRVDAIKDGDIDFSEIPRQDLSQYRPWRELHSKEYVEKWEKDVAAYNAKRKAQKEAASKESGPMYKPIKVPVS